MFLRALISLHSQYSYHWPVGGYWEVFHISAVVWHYVDHTKCHVIGGSIPTDASLVPMVSVIDVSEGLRWVYAASRSAQPNVWETVCEG